jgi:hypothetical protein
MNEATPIKLSFVLKRLAHRARLRAVTLRDLVEATGPAGLGGAIMLLGVITALPTFGIPIATVVSLGILSLAAQLVRGDTRIALPDQVGRVGIGSRAGRRMMYRTSRIIAWIERRTAPRWSALTSASLYPIIGLIVLLMAFIILLPIPMANLVPSIATVLIGAGLMAKDGVLVALGIGTSGIAVAFTTAIAYAGASLINWMM